MKNIKTFVEFINEADAKAALNFIGTNKQNQKTADQERKVPENDKDKKFQQNTQRQALNRTDELGKAAQDINNRQQNANQRMEDIKKKQDLLPDDPNARKQFLDDTQSDLKDVEGELNNAEQQRKNIEKNKERIKNNFLKK